MGLKQSRCVGTTDKSDVHITSRISVCSCRNESLCRAQACHGSLSRFISLLSHTCRHTFPFFFPVLSPSLPVCNTHSHRFQHLSFIEPSVPKYFAFCGPSSPFTTHTLHHHHLCLPPHHPHPHLDTSRQFHTIAYTVSLLLSLSPLSLSGTHTQAHTHLETVKASTCTGRGATSRSLSFSRSLSHSLSVSLQSWAAEAAEAERRESSNSQSVRHRQTGTQTDWQTHCRTIMDWIKTEKPASGWDRTAWLLFFWGTLLKIRGITDNLLGDLTPCFPWWNIYALLIF